LFLCILVLEPEGSHYIKILLTYDIPFVFYDDIAIDRELPIIDVSNVIAAANPDVDVTANDVEIPTFRSTIRPSLDVDKRVSVVQVSTEAVALKGSWNKTGSASA
jgi:hypothetical protein